MAEGRPPTDLPDRCVPCEGGARPLPAPEAERLRRAHVPQWRLEDARLARSLRFPDFRQALSFVNEVGELAEEEGHHPDVRLHGWNRLELELTTHAIGGLSPNDFVLARAIDVLWKDRAASAGRKTSG